MDVRGKFGEHEISLTEFFSLGFMAQAQSAQEPEIEQKKTG